MLPSVAAASTATTGDHEPPAQLTRLAGHGSGCPTLCWLQACRRWLLGSLHGPTAQRLLLRPSIAPVLQGNESQERAGYRRCPLPSHSHASLGFVSAVGSFLPESRPFATLTPFCSLLLIQPDERVCLPPLE